MDFCAKRASVHDAKDMAYVHSASWRAAYRGIVPDRIIAGFTQKKRAAIFEKTIAAGPEEYYLFKADGNPAGIASLHKSHEENMLETDGELYSIYFHPDYWGTSATHEGMLFCLERLRGRGFKRITVWVLRDNARARKFYEKHGFAFDGAEQTIRIGGLLKEVRYAKDL